MIELECQVCHDEGYIMPWLTLLLSWVSYWLKTRHAESETEEGQEAGKQSQFFWFLVLHKTFPPRVINYKQKFPSCHFSWCHSVSSSCSLSSIERKDMKQTKRRSSNDFEETENEIEDENEKRMRREIENEWMNPEGGWIVLKNTSLESPDESFARKERERNWMCCWHCNHPSLLWSLESWEGWWKIPDYSTLVSSYSVCISLRTSFSRRSFCWSRLFSLFLFKSIPVRQRSDL